MPMYLIVGPKKLLCFQLLYLYIPRKTSDPEIYYLTQKYWCRFFCLLSRYYWIRTAVFLLGYFSWVLFNVWLFLWAVV